VVTYSKKIATSFAQVQRQEIPIVQKL